MLEVLARALIERRVMTTETELEIAYKGMDIGGGKTVKSQGTFTIRDVNTTGEKIVFQLISTVDGSIRAATSEQILAIDGMDPARYASVYGIKANGGSAAQQRRRGRKPKPKPERMNGQNNKFTGFPTIDTQESIAA